MALTKQEKNHQMVELVHIVTGIRLFNKECGKGGAGIDDCELGLWRAWEGGDCIVCGRGGDGCVVWRGRGWLCCVWSGRGWLCCV